MKIRYMHLLNGWPAEYSPGQQICYALRRTPLRLALNMNQIRRERKMSLAWRKLHHFSWDILQYKVQKVAV